MGAHRPSCVVGLRPRVRSVFGRIWRAPHHHSSALAGRAAWTASCFRRFVDRYFAKGLARHACEEAQETRKRSGTPRRPLRETPGKRSSGARIFPPPRGEGRPFATAARYPCVLGKGGLVTTSLLQGASKSVTMPDMIQIADRWQVTWLVNTAARGTVASSVPGRLLASAPNREPGLTFPAEARLQVLPGGMEGQGQ